MYEFSKERVKTRLHLSFVQFTTCLAQPVTIYDLNYTLTSKGLQGVLDFLERLLRLATL